MKDRDKIIIFIGTLQSGGAERVVSEISSMYADYFNEVIVLTYYKASVFYKMDDRVRIECVENQTHTKSMINNAFWIRRFVKKERPSVFLSFLMPFNMLTITVLAFVNTKIVVCERQDPSNIRTRIFRALRNFLYLYCDRIETQTLAGKMYFSPILRKKITVIPNPNHISIEQRSKVIGTPKEFRIVTVGRLVPEKNHPMLINVFGLLHKIFPEYRLDIYGDGGLRAHLQQQIDNLGLGSSVTLCGRTNNVGEAISTARVFVLSSTVEGMPNALMEAMALSIPCVATDVSGVRDIITDGENGFIVPLNDEKEMFERIKQLIESDGIQKKFSDNSISVIEKFDKEKINKQWLELVTFN